MKIKVIVPVYKATGKLDRLVKSLNCQTNKNWEAVLSVDACEESYKEALIFKTENISVSLNKDRQFALGNIYSQAKSSADNNIIAIIDGDDELCNPVCFDLITQAYKAGAHLAWTQYCRDDHGKCVSDSIPADCNPYEFKWSASHLRTFGNWVFNKINPENFKDENGRFFRRAYDQALMLPMLYYCNQNNLKTTFIPEVCYKYNHSGSSTPLEEHTNGMYEHQLSKFIRSRGYIE